VQDERVVPVSRPAKTGPEDLELLWIVRQDSHSWSGELQFRGEFYGWDALIRRDGALVVAQRFLAHDKAARFAEDLYGYIERGWTD
jgi:hypothetical protein